MRIKVINPVTRTVLGDDVLPPIPDFIHAELDWLDEGPSSIECRYDDVICVPPLLDRVRDAATDGVDGIVINCFMDPGLKAARELVHVPVAGPAESAMLLAASLGQTFSVILPARSGAPIAVDEAIAYGVRDRLASVRSVEMPVAELSDHERLAAALIEQAELAMAEDGAHTVILGCTGMCGVTEAVWREIENRGHDVPVIDPTLAAIGMLVALHTVGVHHSGRAYEVPAWKSG
jgi:allantoin racemase